MANELKLEIVTPSRKMLEVSADAVTLPGSMGQLGILPEHMPLVTTLDTGILVYQTGGKQHAIAVHWGYAQVDANRVSVLAELAETAEDINLDRARNAESRAREMLGKIGGAKSGSEEETQRLVKYEAKLQRALVRQQVAQIR
ncbi:MAG: F0F1 ATP synthase subunit epsilon [bacterium]|jgi:F-type H+-transporting ATPase subunit epsilon